MHVRGSGPKYERYRAVRSCWVHPGSGGLVKAQKEIVSFDKAVELGLPLNRLKMDDHTLPKDSPFI